METLSNLFNIAGQILVGLLALIVVGAGWCHILGQVRDEGRRDRRARQHTKP